MAYVYYFVTIYVALLSICAIRFSVQNKTANDPYDAMDYIAMMLLSPIFIVHKMYVWMINNWKWLLFEHIPKIISRFSKSVIRYCKWIYSNVIMKVFTFVRDVIKFCNKLINVIYTKLYHAVSFIYNLIVNFVASIKDFVYNHIIEPVILFIKKVIVRIVSFVYNSVLCPLAKFIFENFDRLYNYAIRQLTIYYNYVIRQLTIFYNYVIIQLTIFFKFIGRQLNTFLDFLAKILPKLLDNLVVYVKYVWNGIYDNILHPLYMYLIYYPFYVFIWQNLVQIQLYRMWTLFVDAYNSFIQMMTHFYNAIIELYNKCWRALEDLYAKMFNGRFLRAYNTLSEKFGEIYTNFSERLILAYERLWSNQNEKSNKQD